MVNATTIQPHGAGGWHYLQIAEITVRSHPAHVRKAEAFDRRLLVGVARAVIALVRVAGTLDASRDRVGAKLHHAERRCRTRKRLALAEHHAGAGSDEWIDVARGLNCNSLRLASQVAAEPERRHPLKRTLCKRPPGDCPPFQQVDHMHSFLVSMSKRFAGHQHPPRPDAKTHENGLQLLLCRSNIFFIMDCGFRWARWE